MHTTADVDICSDALTPQERAERVRQWMVPLDMAQDLAEMFKALSDPTRLRIITALAQGEVCVHELSEALGMSQSAVSHQLRLLRHQGLVRGRREGRHIYYRLADEHVYDLLKQALDHLEDR